MEVLTRERISREGLPSGIHVVELVDDRSECALHPHFAGMECVPISTIDMVSNRYGTGEPILIHCDRPEGCDLAAEELGRMGYTNLYRFEGRLQELEPFVSGRPVGVAPEMATAPGWVAPGGVKEAPEISSAELESLLRERGNEVHLFDVLKDASQCPTVQLGVSCLQSDRLEEEGLSEVNVDHTVVLRCQPGIDCRLLARHAFDLGFDDVRVFKGTYSDISWQARM